MEQRLLNIDLEKSLRSKRLILIAVDRFNLYLVYFFDIIMIFASIIISLRMYGSTLLLTSIFLIITIWMISNLLLLNKLVEVNLSSSSVNQLIERFNLEYPELKLAFDDEKKIIQLYKIDGFLNKRIVSILLDDQKAFVNVIKVSKDRAFSPFHGTINYLTCKKLKKVFR